MADTTSDTTADITAGITAGITAETTTPASATPAPASGALDLGELHGSLTDPVLDAMNFLNEVVARFPDAISFAPGRPSEGTFDPEDLARYLGGSFADHLERDAAWTPDAGAHGALPVRAHQRHHPRPHRPHPRQRRGHRRQPGVRGRHGRLPGGRCCWPCGPSSRGPRTPCSSARPATSGSPAPHAARHAVRRVARAPDGPDPDAVLAAARGEPGRGATAARPVRGAGLRQPVRRRA